MDLLLTHSHISRTEGPQHTKFMAHIGHIGRCFMPKIIAKCHWSSHLARGCCRWCVVRLLLHLLTIKPPGAELNAVAVFERGYEMSPVWRDFAVLRQAGRDLDLVRGHIVRLRFLRVTWVTFRSHQ